MARSRLSLKRMLFLTTLLVVSLFSATVLAADAKSTNTKTTPTATQQQATATTPTTTATQQKTTPTTTAKTATSAAKDTSEAADSATSEKQSTTTGATTAVITATGTDTESLGTLPTVTSTAATTTEKLNLPTLSTTDTAIPTYPAPSVPPTQNAPFMQHSSLPDGTVFIAVGSILGGLGVAILIWRAVVAYLLHRSIARASLAQHAAIDKGPFMSSTVPFYKYSDRESSLNLSGAGGAGGSVASGRGVRRTNRGPTPSATPSMTNLFFSPTAPGANGMGTAGNRESRLLPSGFYAAGSASPAGHGQAIGLSNLRPESMAPPRPLGSSPPDSPSFGPMRTTPVPRNDMSTSSVNLNPNQPTGRTPSAYLDDLLDDQPHLFPPGAPGAPSAPGGGAAHQHTYSQSSQSSRRY